jgi:hypothetical protein
LRTAHLSMGVRVSPDLAVLLVLELAMRQNEVKR